MTINDDGTVTFTDEEFNEIRNMLMWISSKYNGWSNLQAEDIEMELWIKTLRVIQAMGKIEMNLLARCAYNKAIDLCRQAKMQKTRNFPLESFEGFENDDESCMRVQTEDDYSSLHIKEMLEIFEPNSREFEYVKLLTTYLGIHTPFNEDIEDCSFGETRRELEIAKKLGYVNDTSQGYRKLKNKVRATLIRNGFVNCNCGV